MSHKLLVEAFAAQNPPTSYHAELPRKLEIWLVPQVRRATGVRVLGFGWGVWSSRTELLSGAASGRGVEGWGQGWGYGAGVAAAGVQGGPRPLPLSAPRAARAQDYVVATETEERDPVPSYVLVHYLKEDAPTHPEVLPPIIIQDEVPPAAQNLDEDETEEVQGSLFAGFHLPAGSFPTSSISSSASSSLALMKRNLDEAGLDCLDDPEAPSRAGKGGRGGRKPVPPRANKNNANSAASAMLALTRQ